MSCVVCVEASEEATAKTASHHRHPTTHPPAARPANLAATTTEIKAQASGRVDPPQHDAAEEHHPPAQKKQNMRLRSKVVADQDDGGSRSEQASAPMLKSNKFVFVCFLLFLGVYFHHSTANTTQEILGGGEEGVRLHHQLEQQQKLLRQPPALSQSKKIEGGIKEVSAANTAAPPKLEVRRPPPLPTANTAEAEQPVGMKATTLLADGACTPLPYGDPAVEWHAENGQDQWLDENVFRGQSNLTFFEFGTADGWWGSNLASFQTHYCWRGICMEPFTKTFKLTQSNRQRACRVYQGAVCPGTQPMEYLRVVGDASHTGLSTWSGLVSTMSKWHRARIDKQVSMGFVHTESVMIPCFPFESVLAHTGSGT